MNHIADANKMVSDTPRTDEAYFKNSATMYDLAGEMKQIERELNVANEKIEVLLIADCERLRIEEELNAANERIKRLEEARVWQPIETAPTDMTWVIGYDAKDGEVGTIIFDLTGDVDDEDVHYEWTDGMRTWNPTHWMPLPEPPEAKEAKP